MIYDVFPFFNELDVLEIRLNELSSVVDVFVIMESRESYGGTKKPLHLTDALATGRFSEFRHKICNYTVDFLEPACTNRQTGRDREAYQRNIMGDCLDDLDAQPTDWVIFSDCDEIPRATHVAAHTATAPVGVHRFKQRSFYYNVNTLVDYGHDFASRARIGRYSDVLEVGGLYNFRMANKNTETLVIENGGWHFGYFGGIDAINKKVATMSPFISEYKMFGDQQLARDIVAGKDLHHRRCELPPTFSWADDNDPTLPGYFLANKEKFKHFTRAHFAQQHRNWL